MVDAHGCPICFIGQRESGFPKKEDGQTVVEYTCGTKVAFQGKGNKVKMLKLCVGKDYGKKYEIWATQGQGGVLMKKVLSLKLALRYVKKHKGEASFAIKYPNRRWHEWK